VTHRPDGLGVSVTDTGIGIGAGEREAVLRRFHRSEKSRHTPGNGLGLSLVAAVARLHGMSLTIEDAVPGCRVALLRPLSSPREDQQFRGRTSWRGNTPRVEGILSLADEKMCIDRGTGSFEGREIGDDVLPVLLVLEAGKIILVPGTTARGSVR